MAPKTLGPAGRAGRWLGIAFAALIVVYGVYIGVEALLRATFWQ